MTRILDLKTHYESMKEQEQPAPKVPKQPEEPQQRGKLRWLTVDLAWKLILGSGLYYLIIDSLTSFLGEFPHKLWLLRGTGALIIIVASVILWEQFNPRVIKRLAALVLAVSLGQMFLNVHRPGASLKNNFRGTADNTAVTRAAAQTYAMTPEQQLAVAVERYTKLWGTPTKVDLDQEGWKEISPSPKVGERVYYLSRNEFYARDDKSQERWKAAVSQHFSYGIRGIMGPLRLGRAGDNTTVYAWIRREG